MQIYWQGHYIDGVTAARQPVKIVLTPAGLQVIKADGNVLLWSYNEINQAQGYHAGEPVRLEKGIDPIESLIVSDASFLHALHSISPAYSNIFHNPDFHKRRFIWITLAAIGAIFTVITLYFWLIPTGAKIFAAHIPPEWEARLGEEVVKQLVVDKSECTEPLLKQSIDRIIQILNSATHKHPYRFKVYIVEDKTVNALAAPGGHLVIFTGLLEQTKSTEELAGVLAHEMQHVLQKHATKNIFQNLSTSLLLTIMFGDIGGMGGAVREGANILGSMKYSRDFEEEADYLGMKLILDAHINPSGMIQFLETMHSNYGKESEIFKYLSTHPPTSVRIDRLRAMAKTLQVTPISLLPDVPWQQVVKSCGKEQNLISHRLSRTKAIEFRIQESEVRRKK